MQEIKFNHSMLVSAEKNFFMIRIISMMTRLDQKLSFYSNGRIVREEMVKAVGIRMLNPHLPSAQSLASVKKTDKLRVSGEAPRFET